ncbi:hypothetical protein LINPERHAP2_LOCUS19641 [Linum perenne]
MGRKKVVDDSDDGEGGRSYFPWNDELDQLLVKSILAIADDNKVDAKGKLANGAHTLLERLMLHEKPNFGVKASPNIVSRCKTLKTKFLAVQELRRLSGAGWDDVKKVVDIDDTSYVDYVEKHPHCAKLNRDPFPCYDGLERVFGKICATGKSAIGNEELDQPVPNIVIPGNMQLGWKSSGSGENQPSPTDQDEQAHIDDRTKLHSEVGKIEGLTREQVFDATLALGRDVGILEIFYSLEEYGRKGFIERLLR